MELSVTEQRYQAVLGVVQDGWKVTEVAERLGVSRQSVHTWTDLRLRPPVASLDDSGVRGSSDDAGADGNS